MAYYKVPLSEVMVRSNGEPVFAYPDSFGLDYMILTDHDTCTYPGDYYTVKTVKYKEFVTGRVIAGQTEGNVTPTPYNIYFIGIDNYRTSEDDIRAYLTKLRREKHLKEYTSYILRGLRRAKAITKKFNQEEQKKQVVEDDSMNSLKARVRLLSAFDRFVE